MATLLTLSTCLQVASEGSSPILLLGQQDCEALLLVQYAERPKPQKNFTEPNSRIMFDATAAGLRKPTAR